MKRDDWEKALPIIQQFVQRVPMQYKANERWRDADPEGFCDFSDPEVWRRRREPGEEFLYNEAVARHRDGNHVQLYLPESDTWVHVTHGWSLSGRYRLAPKLEDEISHIEAKRRHAAGATVQVLAKDDIWYDVPGWASFDASLRYRLKPNAKIRSWAQNEVPVGSAIRMRRDPFNISIILGCSISDVFIGHMRLTYQDALDQAEWRASPETAWRVCGVEA